MTLRKVSYLCLVLCFFVGQTAFLTSTAHGQEMPQPPKEKDINSIFRKYEIATFNTDEIGKRVRQTRTLVIRTENRFLTLEVEPFDIRATSYKAIEELGGGAAREIEDASVTTFKGKIVGQPDTDVRLSIIDDKIEGMILTNTEQLYIEPLKRFDKNASESSYVIYEKSDVLENVDLTLDEKVHEAASEYAPMLPPIDALFALGNVQAVALRELEVATEADYEFVQSLGGAQGANNAVLGILNQVDAIYRRELGLTVKVTFQSAWTTPNDPYGAGLNALLDEFRTYWEANRRNIQRDVAHIFTNNSQNNVAGLAYVGVVCRSSAYSYGLSKYLSTATTRTVVTAHEIGHNLNAAHVNGGSCDSTIMNPGVGPGTQTTFCQISRDQITSYVNQNSSCLTETGQPGGGITVGAIYTIHNQCSDKVLDVSGISQNNGAPIVLWSNLGGANQQFRAQDAGGGNFTFIAQHSGKAIDVQSSGTANGTLVWQYTPNGTNAQRWGVVDVGGGFYKLLPQSSPGKALDVSGASTTDGARIQIWTDNGTCAQKWRFERR